MPTISTATPTLSCAGAAKNRRKPIWRPFRPLIQQRAGGYAEIVTAALDGSSFGNAIMHEMNSPGSSDDPITMLYLNGSRLYLRHYCDAGNRPRMVAKASPDGRTITFSLVDVSGSERYGYMEHAVFTLIDAHHHTEDWTYLEPGNHPVRAHFDLHRASAAVAAR